MRLTWKWWTLLFAIDLLYDDVFSDQIIPVHTGGTFGLSSREPKFKIEFHAEDSPFHHDDDQESMVMPNKKGEKFICFLPNNISSMIVESEEHFKLKTPDELLEVLKGRCFIRLAQEFILGMYDAKATETSNQNLSDISALKDPRSKDASQRYYSHLFTNGTLCDLTNQPRETEVRFVCSEPRAMISSFTELSTCKYALTFQCPTLCKHPPMSYTIHCNALPKDEKEPEIKEEGSQDGNIEMHTVDAEYQPLLHSEQRAT
ncbi:OS-9 homolog [Olea europaea subsp. europaea]|uniref:OS-9 homolog n=1 Tax=Olea europaea subsp. europaea TaxID=158383 RepID=A0A8S0UND1_OLEEU|nr:OS-9 homolog [Olea europaea subsp. europaea]